MRSRTYLVLICVAYFTLLPVVAMAGNIAPNLCLEIWSFSEKPTALPDYVCTHPNPGYPTPPIHCWSAVIGTHVYVAVHVAKLTEPICPTVGGHACDAYGGFLGLPFGIIEVSDVSLTFMSWNACPGFLKGPSGAGEPAACLASSTVVCHDWTDHVGYLYYRNIDGTTSADLTIVRSADTPDGGPWVINCSHTYDEGTIVLGGARLGGDQISCGGMPVIRTIWGQTRGLYR